MPDEVREISGAAGLVEPSVVARSYVNGIINGNYRTVIGLEGWLLGTITGGAGPEKDFVQAILEVHLFILRIFHLILFDKKYVTVRRKGVVRLEYQSNAS